jgi:hypothetical protein
VRRQMKTADRWISGWPLQRSKQKSRV